MKEKIISIVKKYGITFVVMGLFTWGILSNYGYSADTSLVDKYRYWADAFFVPGIIVLLFGVLIWVSTTGFFDAISYGIGVGLKALLPFMRRDDYEKYYDYKVRKDEKRIKGYSFLLISGAIYVFVGAIFTILFTNAS